MAVAVELQAERRPGRHAQVDQTLSYSGNGERALDVLRHAIRLNPYFPAFWLGSVGHAYLTLRRYEEALGPLREAVGQAPRYWPGLGWLAAVCVRLGLTEDARDAIAAIRLIEPTITVSTWGRMISYRHEEDKTHVLDGLRMAGMAE